MLANLVKIREGFYIHEPGSKDLKVSPSSNDQWPRSKRNFGQLKVLDISSVLAGPLTGSFFAELGCHVTKVENKKLEVTLRVSGNYPKKASILLSPHIMLPPITARKFFFLLDFNDAHDRQQLQMLIEKSHYFIQFSKESSGKIPIESRLSPCQLSWKNHLPTQCLWLRRSSTRIWLGDAGAETG